MRYINRLFTYLLTLWRASYQQVYTHPLQQRVQLATVAETVALVSLTVAANQLIVIIIVTLPRRSYVIDVVCLSVRHSVCVQDNSQTHLQTQASANVTIQKWLIFGVGPNPVVDLHVQSLFHSRCDIRFDTMYSYSPEGATRFPGTMQRPWQSLRSMSAHSYCCCCERIRIDLDCIISQDCNDMLQ